MKKRILSALLALALLLSLPLGGSAKGWSFHGRRSVTLRADVSDIDNFIDGGRPAFDLALRRQLPQWAECSVKSHDRQLHVVIRFPFSSYEDYTEKLSVLLACEATVVHDPGDEVLLEAFRPELLLGFLESVLEISEGRTLADLMSTVDNTIELDGTEYSFTGSIAIRPRSQSPLVLEELHIRTVETEDGLLTRQITLRPQGGGEPSDRQRKKLREAGELQEQTDGSGGLLLTVTLEAESLSRLAELTMLCLDTACSVTERQTFREGRTVDAVRSEFIDLEPILTEDGSYSNIWTLPDGDEWHPQEGTLSYRRPFAFTAVTVTQDLSRHFGRKILKIRCSLGISLASHLHGDILEELEEKLIRGSTLDCWDEAGQRHYEISWSTWSRPELDGAATAILGRKAKWERSGSRLPWGTHELKQTACVTGLLEDMHRPDLLRMRYLLPWGSRVLVPDGAEPDFRVTNGDTVRLRWRQPVMENCVLWLLGLGLLLWALLALIRAVKRPVRKHARKKPSPKYLRQTAPAAPEPTPAPAPRMPRPVPTQPAPAPSEDGPVQYRASQLMDRQITDGAPEMKHPLKAPGKAFLLELERQRMAIGRQPSAPEAPVAQTAPPAPAAPQPPVRRRKRGVCPHCGGSIKDGYLYCMYCGGALDREGSG